MNFKPILIIPGEPKSIFYEIFFKSLKIKKFKSTIILIGCKNLLKKELKRYKVKKPLKIVELEKIRFLNLSNTSINIIHVPGIKNDNNSNLKMINQYLNNCFDIALKLIKEKYTKKLINGPINKKKFLNKNFLGVTEYISKKFKIKNFGMLIYNKELSVCPLTTHLPIKLVSKKISKTLITERLKMITNFYKENLYFKPKIAVVGLNPHCESILRYNEDDKIIKPAIKYSKKRGLLVYGPYPADTIFLKQNRKKFNVIMGMYHDQVLTPIKTLYEYNAINITMGLPFLRVSPDHGPNEKMINKNLSNPNSLIESLTFLDRN